MPLYAPIDLAATADIIAAPSAGKRIRVLGYSIVAAGAVTATFKRGSTALTGAMSMITGVPHVAPPGGSLMDRLPVFECGTAEAFNLTLSSGVQVSGWVVYEIVTG